VYVSNQQRGARKAAGVGSSDDCMQVLQSERTNGSVFTITSLDSKADSLPTFDQSIPLQISASAGDVGHVASMASASSCFGGPSFQCEQTGQSYQSASEQNPAVHFEQLANCIRSQLESQVQQIVAEGLKVTELFSAQLKEHRLLLDRERAVVSQHSLQERNSVASSMGWRDSEITLRRDSLASQQSSMPSVAAPAGFQLSNIDQNAAAPLIVEEDDPLTPKGIVLQKGQAKANRVSYVEKLKDIAEPAADRVSTSMQKSLEASSSSMFGAPPAGAGGTEICIDEYDVESLYKKTGLAQAIARHDGFANFTILVIAANAVYIGYASEYNKSDSVWDADLQFVICDNLFCAYFAFEWFVRFSAFEIKFNGFRDRMFMFDTALAWLIIIETWILPWVIDSLHDIRIDWNFLKLVRVLRLARMGRLVRSVPELVAMIKGCVVASRAVGSAFMLLFGLVYVFSIILMIFMQGDDNEVLVERYGNLGKTMWTLLIDASFMDGLGYAFTPLLEAKQYVSFVALLVFVLLSSLTVMNMLIGVLCEVVTSVAEAEKEEVAIDLLKGTLLAMLRGIDEDKSGEISQEEISHILHYEEALAVLKDLNVDVDYFVDSLNMHFEYGGGNIGIMKVMDLILMLRGDRPPTMKDMIHGQTFARWKVQAALKANEKRIKKILKDEMKHLHFMEKKLHDMESLMQINLIDDNLQIKKIVL